MSPKIDTNRKSWRVRPWSDVEDVLVVDEPRHDDAEDDRQDAEHDADPDDRVPTTGRLRLGHRWTGGVRHAWPPVRSVTRVVTPVAAWIQPGAGPIVAARRDSRPVSWSRPVARCYSRPHDDIVDSLRDPTHHGAARDRRRRTSSQAAWAPPKPRPDSLDAAALGPRRRAGGARSARPARDAPRT